MASASCTAAFVVWVVALNFTGLPYVLHDAHHVADMLALILQLAGVGLAVAAVVCALKSARYRVASFAALLAAVGPLLLQLSLSLHPSR